MLCDAPKPTSQEACVARTWLRFSVRVLGTGRLRSRLTLLATFTSTRGCYDTKHVITPLSITRQQNERAFQRTNGAKVALV